MRGLSDVDYEARCERLKNGECVTVSWGVVGDQFDLEGEQSFDEL